MTRLEDQWRSACEPQTVSVIIPTYNRMDVVQDAVKSLQAQTWPKVEIIVVNDGSTDGTSAVLAGMPGVTVIEQRNQGVSAARNAGLLAARGEYIASLDSDDVWHPGFLATVLAAMQKHGCEVGIAAREEKQGGKVAPVICAPVDKAFLPTSEPVIVLTAAQLRGFALPGGLAPNPGVVFHRSVVEPWPVHLATPDDAGQHARVIVRHAPRGVFLTVPLWEVCPKGQDQVSLAGRNDRHDLGWRMCRGLDDIEKEIRPHLTQTERVAFARRRADWLSTDTAYPLSAKGNPAALKAYATALMIDFRAPRLLELIKGTLRVALNFRRR